MKLIKPDIDPGAPYPTPSKECKRWKSRTAEQLKILGQTFDRPEMDSAQAKGLLQILDRLPLVDEALAQFVEPRLEKLRNTGFSAPQRKEWIRDKAEGTDVDREPLCVVSPALVKWGNGAGTRLSELTVIVPVEVLTKNDG
ncbi:MAG: hypothetical protein M1814_002750 [Vezdaea aestivalis]|nr:MAG: hypothetical protein M1814_002750 [Vezdaea aestivalis]